MRINIELYGVKDGKGTTFHVEPVVEICQSTDDRFDAQKLRKFAQELRDFIQKGMTDCEEV